MYKIRELKREDMDVINSWRNDPDLISCLGAPFRFINQEVDYAWFDSYMRNRNKEVRCVVTTNDSDKPICLVSLVNIDQINQSAEFHLMVGESKNRGKGVGTFAIKEMLQHAFLNLNLRRVELTVLATNDKARRLYEKTGFKMEGTKREAKFKNGGFVDMYIYSILKREYTKSQLVF